MTIKCPKCQTDNPFDSNYCKECATQLPISEEVSVSHTKTLLIPPKDLIKGTIFAGRYKFIKELGRGGMGVVYKAEDTKLKRTVALKFLPSELTNIPEVKERFMREAQAAAALDHPNICTVYEFDEAEEKTFISMAFVEGQSLRRKIESGPLELDEVLRIATQVAEGLQEAHKKGIIHRDIKSPNIMVDERDQAKIMDFGLARVAGGTLVTQEGTTMGTIAYMSPEQACGEEVDHRTDIWSFGVVLYEMLSGQLPFKGEKDSSIIYSIEHRQPMPLKEIKPQIPSEVEQVVMKALAKNSDERYQTMDGLLDDLYAISKGIVPPKIKAAIRRARLSRIRRVYLYSGIVVLSVLLIMVGIYFIALQGKAIVSIAVLPFENADPNTEDLSDVLTWSLINKLEQLPSLKKVIARASVIQYKGKDLAPQVVGKELGVDAVLLGQMSKREDELSLSIELMNVKDNSHIWGNDYKWNISEIFELQKEISNSITNSLRLRLSQEEKAVLTKRYTENPEAKELYWKGIYFLDNFDFQKSLEYFDLAIEKDPTYALPHAAKTWNYNVQSALGLPPNEASWRAKEAAEKALELDDKLAEAHAVFGITKLRYDWDWEAAELEIKRAIELSPNSALAHYSYAFYLATMGRLDEALAECKRAIELNPLSLEMSYILGIIFFCRRQNERAIEEYKKILEMNPNYTLALMGLAEVYAYSGKYDEAFAAAKKALDLWGPNQETLPLLGIIYSYSGKKDKAREILDKLLELEKQRYVEPVYFASIYGYLGDMDQAFEWLKKGYDERDPKMSWLRVLQIFDPLRSDHRFKVMLEKMNLD